MEPLPSWCWKKQVFAGIFEGSFSLVDSTLYLNSELRFPIMEVSVWFHAEEEFALLNSWPEPRRPDNIPPLFIKNVAPTISDPLAYILSLRLLGFRYLQGEGFLFYAYSQEAKSQELSYFSPKNFRPMATHPFLHESLKNKTLKRGYSNILRNTPLFLNSSTGSKVVNLRLQLCCKASMIGHNLLMKVNV